MIFVKPTAFFTYAISFLQLLGPASPFLPGSLHRRPQYFSAE